jgi:hypothetical protein
MASKAAASDFTCRRLHSGARRRSAPASRSSRICASTTLGGSRQLIAQASIGLGVFSTPFTVQPNTDLIFADAFAACTP